MSSLRVRLIDAPEMDAYHLLVMEDRADGPYLFANDNWAKLDISITPYTPTLTLKRDWAQALYNEMVAKGFRATESEREKRATERHLDDAMKERDKIFGLLSEVVTRRLK